MSTTISLPYFLADYGTVEVSFKFYHKYRFQFEGIIGNKVVSVSVGGDSDSIYRLFIEPSTKMSISKLNEECEISAIKVTESGNTILETSY